MERKFNTMENEQIKSQVETNKAASALCLRLFPEWAKPPTMGELQWIIIDCLKNKANDEKILAAGNWWLWMRNLIIENTLTKQEKRLIMNRAVQAATKNNSIHFVTTRSPELLHAQIPNLGDPSLPRSKKAILKIAEISQLSERFLPSWVTIIFADLAITNLERIRQLCNLEETIQENLNKIREICEEISFSNVKLIRMSQLFHPEGQLKAILNEDGTPKIPVNINEKANRLIEIAGRESLTSHQSRFGWSKDEFFLHNRNLAITMGLVGQAIQLLQPPPILIHNESFISRGALNNLFTPPDNPLPVICLRDLLEEKKFTAFTHHE